MGVVEKAPWSLSRCTECGEPFGLDDWWFRDDDEDDENEDEAPVTFHLACALISPKCGSPLDALLAVDGVPERASLLLTASLGRHSHQAIPISELLLFHAPAGATVVQALFRSNQRFGVLCETLSWFAAYDLAMVALPDDLRILGASASVHRPQVPQPTTAPVEVRRCPACDERTLEVRVSDNDPNTAVFCCRACGEGFAGDM